MGLAGRLVLGLLAMRSSAGLAQNPEDLQDLSVEELANIPISSVSKAAEPLSDAAAAVYVITHDEIIRSGLTTLPEILRLAPNLEVAQLSATTYAISARGFNVGDNASMSDKLLVLIDGRIVYTQIFAGVYWDMQSVLPEDIERIEIISGPGATLWGANAVNGVINIITRKSADTQGGVLDIGAGNLERRASLQYGGRIADDLSYRIHVEGTEFSPNKTSQGTDAEDGWSTPQGGFRIDWSPGGDLITAEGDIFHDTEFENNASGRDLVASWRHSLGDGSSLQFEAYYDEARRSADDFLGFVLDTYNFDIQHSFPLGEWNSIVWGAGNRLISYQFANIHSLAFEPAGRTQNFTDAFVQDTMALDDTVKLTLGIKLENEPYSGLEPMPSARVSWKIWGDTLLWAAVSRAVRAPTPVDTDLRETLGNTDFLNGSTTFMPEVLTAYEIGTRVQPTSRLSFSASSFYDVYSDLRSLEFSPTTGFLPLQWGNRMQGLIYGVEVWGSYQAADWWRLTAGFNLQHEHLRFERGSPGLGGLQLAADDPSHQAQLRSSINLGADVTWDADFRYVGRLPNPAVPEYVELGTRIGWKISGAFDVSISGFNLLHSRHQEFIEAGQTDEVPRSFFVETRWRF